MRVPFAILCSDICLNFPAEVDAQFVLRTLEVDDELQPDKIHRTLTVKGPTSTCTHANASLVTIFLFVLC